MASMRAYPTQHNTHETFALYTEINSYFYYKGIFLLIIPIIS